MRNASDFDKLYRQHAPAAFRRARRLLGTESDAHEVVHEVFLWLFERPHEFEGQSRISSPLHNAVTTACLNQLSDAPTRARLARSGAGDPLRPLLMRMPAAFAEAAVCHYLDELTPDEIARVLGSSRAQVDEVIEHLAIWMADQRDGAAIERTRPEGCPSDLVLDAWTADELAPNVVAQVQKHLAHCAPCTAHRSQYEQASAAFLGVAPTFAAQRKLVAAARPPAAPIRSRATAVAAGAFALIAIGGFGLLSARPWEDAPLAGSKGAAHLGVLVERGKRVTRGASDVEVQAGDRLLFTHTSDRDVYLVLFNIEEHGASVYFPKTGKEAQRVRAGADVALPFSTQVDATSGTGRVVGVFCRAPFEIAPLLAILNASGSLTDDQDCHVDALRLKQVPAP